ncbi:MAG: PHP domain-containing protein, partial [Chloroflexi bacterium]|nr:PHP domain-containing protein [Chloroflexota bacterium]
MWFKGNIHTHTNKSDGDSDPEPVVRWYRRNGYDFLVLTDHNHLTLLDYGSKKRRFRRPLMIPGEELSVRISNGKTAIHLNGIGITRMVEPLDAGDVV